MHVRMHHHGLIKLEDDGAGGFLMPLDDVMLTMMIVMMEMHTVHPDSASLVATKIAPISEEKNESERILQAFDVDEKELLEHQKWEARKHRRRLEKRLAARLLLHRSRALQQCPLSKRWNRAKDALLRCTSPFSRGEML